ncbi:MAG: 16S rRNA (uracil(1498)-N(3))-methyltransferase [Bacteroidales bacterium]|nr:16S rRNA (uracil(1498)-N(3))-methyltransferase [Bacteroidales bacterium]
MQLFYNKDITPDGYCTLDAEESRHAVRVLRLREGDELHVTDGCGNMYCCQVVEADDKGCVVECKSPRSTLHAPLSVHLAVAPTKNPSRMEWLVEKAVEIGVGEITLLDCDHSERSFLKTERLQKIAVSAMKQSLRIWLPRINPATSLRDWLHSPLSALHSPLKLIAHCESDQPRVPLADALQPGRDAMVLIGPEGDFSAEEIALALEHGYQPVSLGPSRLRTETAALYAVAAFNFINDRL